MTGNVSGAERAMKPVFLLWSGEAWRCAAREADLFEIASVIVNNLALIEVFLNSFNPS